MTLVDKGELIFISLIFIIGFGGIAWFLIFNKD
jgi:hypothetical protein